MNSEDEFYARLCAHETLEVDDVEIEFHMLGCPAPTPPMTPSESAHASPQRKADLSLTQSEMEVHPPAPVPLQFVLDRTGRLLQWTPQAPLLACRLSSTPPPPAPAKRRPHASLKSTSSSSSSHRCRQCRRSERKTCRAVKKR